MQFIRASRDSILKPLSMVAGIVERRHTLPILANVLMRKDGEAVSFLASDVEIQIRTTASLGAGEETGATTVSARKLIDILRALPEGPEVSISVADKKATIKSGKSRFALQTLEADDFPTVAVNEHFAASFALPQKQNPAVLLVPVFTPVMPSYTPRHGLVVFSFLSFDRFVAGFF